MYTVRSSLGAAVIAALLLCPSAFAGEYAVNESPSDALAQVGGEYYLQYCSACHGRNAHGDGPVASSLAKRPPDLTRIAKRRGGEFPLVELAAFIDGRGILSAHGSRDMPVWGRSFAESVGGGELGDEVVRGRLLALLEFLRMNQQ